jgi:hypothetical protein
MAAKGLSMRWVWGILLAVVLIALMPFLQALLEATKIVQPSHDDQWFHAFAIEAIALLVVLIFRRPGARPRMRVIRPRQQDIED